MDTLQRVPRPSFTPKVVVLYEQLFKVRNSTWEDARKVGPLTGEQDFVAEEQGFPYDDLFLLQPRPAELAKLLSSLDGNDFSSIYSTTQQLFQEGVKTLQSGDESKLDNALIVFHPM
jgi:hypothetical protein